MQLNYTKLVSAVTPPGHAASPIVHLIGHSKRHAAATPTAEAAGEAEAVEATEALPYKVLQFNEWVIFCRTQLKESTYLYIYIYIDRII